MRDITCPGKGDLLFTRVDIVLALPHSDRERVLWLLVGGGDRATMIGTLGKSLYGKALELPEGV